MLRLITLSLLLLIVPVMANAEEQLPRDPDAIFPVEELTIVSSAGEFRFSVEIADEPHERTQGLMHRTQMLPTHGMLFDFGTVRPVFMWMSNTPRSLDMIFIRPDGTVARVETDTVPFSEKVVSSGEPVSHVLELNAGMSRLVGLKVNDRIQHRFFNSTAD